SPSLVLGRVVAPVRFLPRSIYFADCKLYIRTRLLASTFSNFWNPLLMITSVPLQGPTPCLVTFYECYSHSISTLYMKTAE
ncbi:hypothetical protein F5879DRAFT_937085, partial [Lentinula edodes]